MESSDLRSEKKKKKIGKKKSKTEASDVDSEKKKMKKKSKMEASDLDSEKKKKDKKKSKAEASDFEKEKKMRKQMKKEMRTTKASDLESEKNKKMKKSKNKNMSLAIEEYEPETDPVEMKTSLESSSVDPEAEKVKMSLEKKTSQEEEEIKAIPDEKETNPVEKEANFDEKEANPVEKEAKLDEKEYLTEDEYLDTDEDTEDDGDLRESDVPEYLEYCKKLVGSGGFDIDRCPPIFQCVHLPLEQEYLMKNGGKVYNKLCRFSTMALQQYNRDNDTDYQFAKFEKAVSAPCAGEKYYITFEAKEASSSDDASTTTFQALVYEGIPNRSGPEIIEKIKVMLVRIKSEATTKDNDVLLG